MFLSANLKGMGPILKSAARVARLLLTLTYGVILAVALWPICLLLAGAETIEGWVCGAVTAIVLALTGALLVGATRRVSVPLALAAALLLAWVVHRAPDGRPLPGSRLSSHFSAPATYPRFSPFNLLPEVDQVRLGATFAPQIAARIGSDATERVLSVTMPIYHEIRADPEMIALGSVMHLAFTNTRDTHYWQYIPEHRPGEKLPLLVFFHGSGGNFASYLWFWRQAADRLRVAVVLPTMGWGKPSWELSFRWPRDPAIDITKVWVAGLSTGSNQAMATAAKLGDACHGAILVSPVQVPPYCVRHRLPVLVVYGAQDRVINQRDIENVIEAWSGILFDATRLVYPSEDHFLMFIARQRFLDDLESWMRKLADHRRTAADQPTGPSPSAR